MQTQVALMSKFPNFQQIMPKRNVLLQGLHCKSVPATASHPNNYWNKDGKRFVKLADKAIKNNAELILINFDDTTDKVKLIKVETIDPALGITNDTQRIMTKRGYNQWLSNAQNTYNII